MWGNAVAVSAGALVALNGSSVISPAALDIRRCYRVPGRHRKVFPPSRPDHRPPGSMTSERYARSMTQAVGTSRTATVGATTWRPRGAEGVYVGYYIAQALVG